MATNKKQPHIPNKSHGYKVEDLVQFLEDAADLYPTQPQISFHKTLKDLGCTYNENNWAYWTQKKKNKKVLEGLDVLRNLQEQKVIEGAMSEKYNPAFSMFFLKCKRGYIEEQHASRITLDKAKLELQKEQGANPEGSKDIKIEILTPDSK